MNEAGKNIKNLRQNKDWSQGDVAANLKISVAAYSKIESGRTDINVSRLEQIANLFKVPAAQILSPGSVFKLRDTPSLNLETCKVCGTATQVIFNIQFTKTYICESCAESIFLQQANWYVKENKN